MPELNLLPLLFGSQSRKPIQRKSPPSRARILADGREILRGYQYEKRRRQILERRCCALCGFDFDFADVRSL